MVTDSRAMTRLILVVSAVLLLVGHLWIGLRTNWLPCTLDCGESYEAYVAGRNLARFGFRYAGGLFDFALSPDPGAHPVLYTHMLHLGMYRQAALFKLGVRSVHAQAALQIVPFSLGLLYLYLAIKVVTGSRLLASCCLLQASSLYLLVALWGFQSERVWSWLVTFGIIYHLTRWTGGADEDIRRHGRPEGRSVLRGGGAAAGPRSVGVPHVSALHRESAGMGQADLLTGRHRLHHLTRRGHLTLAMLCMVVSFGMDYTFVLFTAALVVALSIFGIAPLRPRPLGGVLALAFGLPFLLQQIHVASFVGVSVWWTDFVYSILRRIPLASLVAPAPTPAVLDTFYSTRHIVAWPGGGGPYIPLIWAGLIVRAYGAVLGWEFLLILAAWVVGVVGLRRASGGPIPRGLRLSLALAVAMVACFAVFGEYMGTFYSLLLMPLVVHWVVLVLGLATYVLIPRWRWTVQWGRLGVPVGGFLLVSFLVWRVSTEVTNIATLPPAPYPGADALEQQPGKSVVTYWISSAPSAYTDQWAATLLTMRWLLFSGHDRHGFDPTTEYYMLMAADPSAPRYRHPDLLLLPRLNAWGLRRRCAPFGGAVAGFADGCSDIETPAAIAKLPIVRRGHDYILYDLHQSDK